MSLLFVFSILLLVVLLGKLVIFVTYSIKHRRSHVQQFSQPLTWQPLVSVIVPCFNEELVLDNCVESLQDQTYRNLEIILVDDGSSDATHVLSAAHAAGTANITALSKVNGGKASALNHGIAQAQGEFVICMDADSMFMPDTVDQLIRPFANPEVGAVGGNVRVANRGKLLAKHQTVEYIAGLTIQRAAFASIGCMQVISGAIGAFRKTALQQAGGYSTDTIVEDMDITVSVARAGYEVSYNPFAIAYTEAPENVRDFLKQRYRWVFGTFQVLKKHKDMAANREHGRMGMVGLPYCMVFPWVDACISLLLIIAVLRVAVYGNFWVLLAFYLVLTTIQCTMLLYALTVDGEDKRLVFMAVIEHFFYSHLINYTTVKAGINYQLGKSVNWNKLVRLGKNSLGDSNQAQAQPRETAPYVGERTDVR